MEPKKGISQEILDKYGIKPAPPDSVLYRMGPAVSIGELEVDQDSPDKSDDLEQLMAQDDGSATA